jgi:hypothetical protein
MYLITAVQRDTSIVPTTQSEGPLRLVLAELATLVSTLGYTSAQLACISSLQGPGSEVLALGLGMPQVLLLTAGIMSMHAVLLYDDAIIASTGTADDGEEEPETPS